MEQSISKKQLLKKLFFPHYISAHLLLEEDTSSSH